MIISQDKEKFNDQLGNIFIHNNLSQLQDELSRSKVLFQDNLKNKELKRQMDIKLKKTKLRIPSASDILNEKPFVQTSYLKQLSEIDQNTKIEGRQPNQQQLSSINLKSTINQLSDSLQTAKNQYDEIQQKKEEVRQTKIASMRNTSKFSSFAAVINRKPFIETQHTIVFFDPKKEIYTNIGMFMDSFEKQKLIEPTHSIMKGEKRLNFQTIRPLAHNLSDFGFISENQLSEKEIQRLQYWQTVTQEQQKKQHEDTLKQQDQILKKKLCEIESQKIKFKPSNSCLGYFTVHPTLISEFPQTHDVIDKIINLPRVYEKKVWIPNKKTYL